jgi:hypothetical protein
MGAKTSDKSPKVEKSSKKDKSAKKSKKDEKSSVEKAAAVSLLADKKAVNPVLSSLFAAQVCNYRSTTYAFIANVLSLHHQHARRSYQSPRETQRTKTRMPSLAKSTRTLTMEATTKWSTLLRRPARQSCRHQRTTRSARGSARMRVTRLRMSTCAN